MDKCLNTASAILFIFISRDMSSNHAVIFVLAFQKFIWGTNCMKSYLSLIINFIQVTTRLGVVTGCFIIGSIIRTFREILFSPFTLERITNQSFQLEIHRLISEVES